MAKARKRQKFFDVEMPLLDRETQLYGYSFEDLDGRTITYDLTRILRGKAMLLKLKVEAKEKGEKSKAQAFPIEINLMPYFLRRAMRKGTNYVETSFKTKTKTHEVTIKSFLVTRKKVSRVVRKALRDQVKEELEKYLKENTSEQVFQDLLKNKLQKDLSLKLKKTYPLSFCEIRFFKIEKLLKKSEEEKEEKEAVKESKKKTKEEKEK